VEVYADPEIILDYKAAVDATRLRLLIDFHESMKTRSLARDLEAMSKNAMTAVNRIIIQIPSYVRGPLVHEYLDPRNLSTDDSKEPSRYSLESCSHQRRQSL